MAGGKVTVRQKMINMMYLVLTALLALNVSAEVLKAFHLVEVTMEKAGVNIDKKNADNLAAIDKYIADNKTDKKGPEVKAKAMQVQKVATEALKYLADLKTTLVNNAGGRKDGNPEEEVDEANNIEKHANLLIVKDGGAKGKELRDNINKWRTEMVKVLDTRQAQNVKSDLIAEPSKNSKETWEAEMFEHTPVAAVVAILAKIENDVKNTESQVLDELKKELTAVNVVVDQFKAYVIPTNGTYITQGNKYTADIILAASSSRSTFDLNVGGSNVKVEDGTGKYEAGASSEGEKKYKAVITQKQLDGTSKTYEAEASYFVLKPLAVISATKMNVVYIGLDNPISISVPGVSAREVKASCSAGGTLSPAGQDGTYNLRVDGSQREITITATVTTNGKSTTMGFQKYRVRPIPKPLPQLGSIDQSGSYAAGQIKAANFVITALKDFAFEGVNYSTLRWTMIYQPKRGDGQFAQGSGANITGQAKSLLQIAKPGDTYTLTGISAQGPAGPVNLPSSLTVTVRQ